MSDATPCLKIMRAERDAYRERGEIHDARVVERLMMKIQRRIGDRQDAIDDLDFDSARMPLDGPVR